MNPPYGNPQVSVTNLSTRNNDWIAIAVVAAIAAVVGVLVPAEYLPFVLGGVGLAVIMVLWANFGDMMTLILLWFVATACFSYFFWRVGVPIAGGTVNITFDRILIAGIVLTALLSLLIGKLPYKSAPAVLKVLLLLLVFFTISYVHSGFKSIAEVSPHFRLIGGYYFPFIALVLTYFAVNDEPQIKKICCFFLLFGLYLTLTAWAEYFKVWSIVFPKYISDPELGIHWGRARGPFLVSASLGITLVFCFFNNWYLANHTNGFLRILIHLANLAMLPAIFFTQTRSVWLAMIICVVVWLKMTHRLRSRGAVLLLILAGTIILSAIFWSEIISRERRHGGIMEEQPIFARLGLARVTWQIFTDHPILGVGFGHFRDFASQYAQDPNNKYVRWSSQVMEHNNFLSILAEGGIVGFVLYFIVLLMIFRYSLRLYRRIPPEADGWVSRELVVLYWMLMIDYLVDGMFRETSFDPFNNGLFFAFTGLILAVDYLLNVQQTNPIFERSPNLLSKSNG
jgi:O-antigen ligase